MFPTNVRASEQIVAADFIAPDKHAAETVTTGWVDASVAHRFLALIQIGVFTPSASPIVYSTLDAKLQQATSSGGAGAKDITGKAITQATHAVYGAAGQAEIDLSGDELDVNGGFRYIRLSITITGAQLVAFAAALIGFNPHYPPGSDSNNASVKQIVN